jgi:hypothetical protein
MKKQYIVERFLSWLDGTLGSPFEKTIQVGLSPQKHMQRPVGILLGTTNERQKARFGQHSDAEWRVFAITLALCFCVHFGFEVGHRGRTLGHRRDKFCPN